MTEKEKELKYQLKIEQAKAQRDMFLGFISNPVVEIIMAYIVIESLQKADVIPEIAGSIAEGGCLTAVGIQQLSPYIPAILQGTSEGVKSVASLVPLLG